MPGAREVPLGVRQILGVNLLDDPAFLGPQYLQLCDSWVPDLTGVLSKRRGTAAYLTIPGAITRVDALRAAIKSDGTRYVYAAVDFAAGADALYVSTNDGAFAAVTGGGFAGADQRYGFALYGDTLYAGNGVDVLKEIPLGGAAVDRAALALTNDAGLVMTVTADGTSELPGGTYSFAWAIYDATANPGKWFSRGPVRRVTIASTWARLDWTAPAAALGANQTYHLFVAPVDEEIEGAHDQTPNGVGAASTGTMMAITINGPAVPIPSTVTRTGRFLVPHRGRIFIAGNVASPRLLTATSVLVPGLEDTIYNQGTFFPANAYAQITEPITGIAVASLTSSQLLPVAPLVLFGATSTWLLLGDILNDPNAALLQISARIGCLAHGAIVATKAGLIFPGQESVYLVPPTVQEPVDIGWPISPAIRAIPRSRRPFVTATFHKGFYKLAVTPAGGATNVVEWWLDLRRGLGSTPQWTGPHTHNALPVACFAQSSREPDEDDRAWVALDSGGAVLLMDQPGHYDDNGTTIVSRMKSGRLDGGQPFQRKVFTRLRCMARTSAPTGLSATVTAFAVDQQPSMPQTSIGTQSVSGLLPLPGAAAAIWGTTWIGRKWGSPQYVEGQFVSPAGRLRALAYEVAITHAEAIGVDLRDLELREQLVERAVA